ncbi:MAG: hypothetical protein DME01_04375 [Candidatus Rokuibacteriota bacterium]|nr:MAG: hypothetical protein DME01_04375 [Candidatus Rokubacteria bacterium]
MSNHSPESDDAIGARLRTELRRYPAPAYLRGSIGESAEPLRARPAWLAPTLAAAATALVLVLVSIPFLPRILPADPTERLVRSVVAEHTRALMWGARRTEVVPTALPWLTQESGIALRKFFVGDDRLVFVGAEPIYLEERRGMALYYRDGDGHLVTYTALPAPGLPLPEARRIQIENRWRPALMSDSGFSAWVWRQGDLACFIVADMVSESDVERFKDYFVRLRVSTEPVPAN